VLHIHETPLKCRCRHRLASCKPTKGWRTFKLEQCDMKRNASSAQLPQRGLPPWREGQGAVAETHTHTHTHTGTAGKGRTMGFDIGFGDCGVWTDCTRGTLPPQLRQQTDTVGDKPVNIVEHLAAKETDISLRRWQKKRGKKTLS